MKERRYLLTAALAAPFLPQGARTALAQAPAPSAAKQAPGFFRTRLGSLALLTVSDGYGRRPDPTQGFVRNAEPEQVATALRNSFLPTDHLNIPYTVPFLETPRGLIAFDTGTGGQLGATAGRMHENLRAAGHDPASVTQVVFTHFHGDHVTGLTTAADEKVFPNAELHVPRPEWNYWMDEGTASRTPEAMRAAFSNVRRRFAPYEGRVRIFDPGAEVLPGIRSVATHGHTPGHTSFVLSDGSDSLMVLGDVTNRPELFARNPGWHAVFDMDAAAAEATRRRVLDMLSAERMRLVGYHYPFPASGFMAKDGEGYRFVPADWVSAT